MQTYNTIIILLLIQIVFEKSSADGKNCSSTSINVNPDIDDPDDASLTPSEIDRASNYNHGTLNIIIY